MLHNHICNKSKAINEVKTADTEVMRLAPQMKVIPIDVFPHTDLTTQNCPTRSYIY